MADKDGGPAYPQLGRCDHDTFDDLRGGMVREERLLTNGGMTLRDYFAGQALGSFDALTLQAINQEAKAKNVTTEAALAKFAFDIADAMLAERAK